MPTSIIDLKSHAKINIFLDVLKKRPDGYHEINTLFAPLELHDKITLEKTSTVITVSCNDESVPLDHTNLAVKAAALFFGHAGIDSGVKISIEKNIPVAAGLGGGSSNAAATLTGLNAIFDAPFSDDELRGIAKDLGADVPFFIDSVPTYARGIGEEFTAKATLPEMQILLVNPDFEVSAAWAYSNLLLSNLVNEVKYTHETFSTARAVATMLRNTLEPPVIKKHPVINKIKRTLVEEGALGALMSGSGPTVFGIFEDREKATAAKETVQTQYKDSKVILTQTK